MTISEQIKVLCVRQKISLAELARRLGTTPQNFNAKLKNYKKLPGNPDIVLTKYKIAIFCDGEFFHGKDWEVLKPRLEKSNNSEFWISKISRNRERDDEVNKRLLFEGWTVIRFWGDDIKKHTDECVKVVEEAIFDLNFDESEDFN